MKRLVVLGIMIILTACGGGGGSSSGPSPGTGEPGDTGPTLESIDLESAESRIPLGRSLSLTATGIYSDLSSVDLVDTANWEIEHPDVVDWDRTKGHNVLRAKAPGQSRVRVFQDGIEAGIQLTVTDAVLEQIIVQPARPRLAAGMEAVLDAVGLFSDQTGRDITDDITWTVDDPAVAVIEGRRLHALAAGITTIKAELDGREHTLTLTVTDAVLVRLEPSPAEPSVAVGVTVDIRVTGIFSDSSKKDMGGLVDWDNPEPAMADVSTEGTRDLLTGVSPGRVTLTAERDGIVASLPVTVTEARLRRIELSPAGSTMAKGQSRSFRATGIYTDQSSRDLTETVLWESDDLARARVSNAAASKGRVTALSMGTVGIGAALGAVAARTEITVGEAALESVYLVAEGPHFPAGLTRSLSAMGRYSDDSVQDLTGMVTWASSDLQVAVVGNGDDGGRLTGLEPGEVTVSACLDGIDGRMTLTIEDPLLTDMEVSPAAATLPAGHGLALTAVGRFTDGAVMTVTDEVLWTSSDPAAARVDNASGTAGTVFALAPGRVSISGVLGGIERTVDLTVTAATLEDLEVVAGDGSLPAGLVRSCRALGHFSDGEVQDLTDQVLWQVSDRSRAGISNVPGLKGRLYAFAPGPVTISAAVGAVTGQAGLTVTGETLRSLRFSPPFAAVDAGSSATLTLEGIFSDGSVLNLGEQALWLSLDPRVATVGSAPLEAGTVTGIAPGATYVLAVLGQVGAVTAVQVLKPLDHIEIHAVSDLLPLNWTLTYTATAVYEDGESEDVTDRVVWTSSDRAVADFFDFGRMLALSEGTTQIGVSVNGMVQDSARLEVLAFESLVMGYESLGGGAVQFRVQGLFTDGRGLELTEAVTWSSDNGAVLSISDTEGEKGLAQVHQPGTCQVTAEYDEALTITRTVVIQP
ncbi:hypothetical protein JCM14469_36100 [Desulfatiferula olefinivorans]